MNQINTRNFSQVILKLFSFIFIFSGLSLLIFTESIQQAALTELKGIGNRVSILLQQFLGNSYILSGLLIYSISSSRKKSLYIILSSLFIMGFINLYLIFQFNDIIFLPDIYFIFQSLLQVLIFFALIDELRRNV